MRARELIGIEDSLRICFAPSLEAQRLDVLLRVPANLGLPNGFFLEVMDNLVSLVQHGLAGGDLFAPEAGSARIVRPPARRTGTEFFWQLEVAGVCPEFVRMMVDRMAWPVGNRGVRVQALEIKGSKEDVPTIREREIIDWLERWDVANESGSSSVAGTVRPWPHPPFAQKIHEGRAMAAAHATLVGPVTQEQWDALMFSYTPQQYDFLTLEPAMDQQPTEPAATHLNPVPGVYWAANYLVVYWDPCAAPGLAFHAAMINSLSHYHHHVAPIREVQVLLPS